MGFKKSGIVTAPQFNELYLDLSSRGYTPLEYLKANRGAWFKTGHTVTSKTSMKLDIKMEGTFNNNGITIFSSATFSTVNRFSLNFGSASGQDNNLFTWITRGYDGTTAYSLDITNETKNNKNTIYVDRRRANGGYYGIHQMIYPTLSSTESLGELYLLASSTELPFDAYNAYIYGCSLYEDGVLTDNLVPVKRKSDNVIGLYNTSKNVFISSSGSVTPIAGTEGPSNFSVHKNWISAQDFTEL